MVESHFGEVFLAPIYEQPIDEDIACSIYIDSMHLSADKAFATARTLVVHPALLWSRPPHGKGKVVDVDMVDLVLCVTTDEASVLTCRLYVVEPDA